MNRSFRLTANARSRLQPGRGARVSVGGVIAALLVAAAQLSGWVAGSDATLIVMGFDPDRAQLITALLIGASAALAVGLATDTFVAAVLLGALGAGALYVDTFRRETVAALGATGADGSFDPGGWLLTLVTLVTSAFVIAWIAATLARPIRRRCIEATQAVVEAAAQRRLARGRLGRSVGVVVIVLLLAVSLPALGDLLNYAPDSLMLHGGPPQVGLVPDGGAAPSAAPTPAGTAPPAASPSVIATPTPLMVIGPRPWLAWRPSGPGHVITASLAAPWVGGGPATITIYLPPGYDGGGSRRYPVLYEAPMPFSLWDRSTNAKVALDRMIDQGTIPPSIMVFIESSGGPYPDSECADSFDGREWFDRFVGVTVPAYVDVHFRTIPTPAARTVLGMSQGGYCAAILALHHPDVFGAEISFSGYFQAGAVGVNSGRPFGGDQALLAADSPSVVAPGLPAGERGALYFVLIAEPSQSFYGPQATAFAQTITQAGYPHTLVAAALPHGWSQVRAEFPIAAQLIAQWEVAQGVFA